MNTACKIAIFSAITLYFPSVWAKDYNRPLRIAGDIGQYAIPVAAMSTTLILHDYKGSIQLLEAMAAETATVYALKYIVNEKRPGGKGTRSFPSGHTALAFCGAGFIQRRYGLVYALPAYAGAIVVATARVQSKAHWIHDVVAGAAIGMFYSFIITRPYHPKIQIEPEVSKDGLALRCSHKF
jgi:membrane-associated phospholipid phosphatase